MSTIKVASTEDLEEISEAARTHGGRAFPEGAEGHLSEHAAHILTRTEQEPRRNVNAIGVVWHSVRVRASVALAGEPLPAECFLDVDVRDWAKLIEAREAMELMRLNPKWKVPSVLGNAITKKLA